MAMQELVTVYTLTNPMKAEILKNFLEGEGIRCFLEGAEEAADAGLPGIDIKIQVPAADAERARELITSHGNP